MNNMPEVKIGVVAVSREDYKQSNLIFRIPDQIYFLCEKEIWKNLSERAAGRNKDVP